MWTKLLVYCISLPLAFGALPNGWKACSRSAPDYDVCFLREITNAVNTLINGDKKLAVPSLNPLRIEKLVIPKRDSPVSLDLSFSDLSIREKDFKILETKNDWKTMKGVIHYPEIIVNGNYKVDGKIMVLPVKGEGKFNMTFHDVDSHAEAIWKKVNKNGKSYFQMDKYMPNFKPKHVKIYFDNLFNGNKVLGDSTNLFINENWEKIFEELSPALNEGLSQALVQISNKVLSKIPAEEIDLP